MVYKKEIKCEICGKITIAGSSTKKFCKDCLPLRRNEWHKEWFRKNPDKYEKHKEICKLDRKKYPETMRRKTRKYVEKYPEIVKAQRMAKKIPLKEKCQICGSINRLERHHWRYDKPLLVATLCKECHTIQHNKNIYGGLNNCI